MKMITHNYWSNYEVEVLSGLPKKGATYTFKQNRKPSTNMDELVLEVPTNASDWLVLRVTNHDGARWVGHFEPGLEGISGLYATPSESVLCVVVRGQGFWVPVESPEDYQIIPSVPVKSIVAIPDAKIMVFADFVRLTAYDRNGLMWQTPSLSWDGLTITKVVSNRVEGVAWDAPNNQEVKFIVNTLDGTYTGGSSPELHSAASR